MDRRLPRGRDNLTCIVCGGASFERRADALAPFANLLAADLAARQEEHRICAACGFVHWFAATANAAADGQHGTVAGTEGLTRRTQAQAVDGPAPR